MANNKNLIGLTINDTYIARPFAICPSFSISANKAVSWPGFNLVNGATILVKFTYENNADNITLDVNGTGAIPILHRGEPIIKANRYWASNDIIEFRYDGYGWQLIGNIYGIIIPAKCTYKCERYIKDESDNRILDIVDVKYEDVIVKYEIKTKEDGSEVEVVKYYTNIETVDEISNEFVTKLLEVFPNRELGAINVERSYEEGEPLIKLEGSLDNNGNTLYTRNYGVKLDNNFMGYVHVPFTNYTAGEGILISKDESFDSFTQKISVDREWLDNILKDYATLEYVNNTFLKLAGGTITGDLVVEGSTTTKDIIGENITTNKNLVVNGSTTFQEKYVVEDDLNTALNNYLLKSGGTITGDLTVNGSTTLNDLTVEGNVIADAFYEVVDDYQSSDERLKNFEDDIEIDFERLKDIRKKYFTWKSGGNREIGVAAQDIQNIYPEIVKSDKDGYLKVSYEKLSVIALRGLDKLYDENVELKNKLEYLENRIKDIEKILTI